MAIKLSARASATRRSPLSLTAGGINMTIAYDASWREQVAWNWFFIRRSHRLQLHLVLLMCVLYAITFGLETRTPNSRVTPAVGAADATLVFLIVVVLPLLVHRPYRCVLKVKASGLASWCREKWVVVQWPRIDEIVSYKETIFFFGKWGKLFVAPRRAFSSIEEQHQFECAAREWFQQWNRKQVG
jgi:hypothetical protein